MKRLADWFQGVNARIMSIVGMIAMAAMIWNINQLLPYGIGQILGSVWAKVALMMAIFTIWGAYEYRMYRQAGKREGELQEMPGQEDDAALKSRFKEAIDSLRQRRGKEHVLTDLPWYIFIGPPSSGKTRLAQVIDPTPESKTKGMGGTRNCDWFFTPEAVLIDTAGRYINNVDAANDQVGWQSFVKLLKKSRPIQPINGAVVTFSLIKLKEGQPQPLTEQEIDSQAKEIRIRLCELRQQLGIRFPVYMIFTKMDLEAGFRLFFKGLEEKQRDLIWGITLPYALDGQFATENTIIKLEKNFKILELWLHELMFVRLGQLQLRQLSDIPLRHPICTFPQQMHRLMEVAERFVSIVFSPIGDEPSLLRGVYFTSSTQEGQPIDSLLEWFSRRFSLDISLKLANQEKEGRLERSYFVHNLFNDVVFKDKGLAGRNRKLEQRKTWFYWIAVAGSAALALVLCFAWYKINQLNNDYAEKAKRDSEDLIFKGGHLGSSASIIETLPLLDQAKLVRDDTQPSINPMLRWASLGLNPYDVLREKSDNLYQEVLRQALLPRLIVKLEDNLKSGGLSKNEQNEAYRVYLMLDDSSVFDSKTVQNWFENYFKMEFTAIDHARRVRLIAHLETLLEKYPVRTTGFKSDSSLINKAKDQLRHGYSAKEIYRQVEGEIAEQNLTSINIEKMAGDNAYRVFGNISTSQISGLFTPDGYQKFKQTLDLIINNNAQDSRIVGQNTQSTSTTDLKSQVMKIYRQEYSEHWRKLLSELEILPPKDSNELKNLVHIVADPQSSPLTSLLDKAYEQTNFADFDPVLKQEIGLSENKGLAEFPDPKQTAETMKKIEPILADVGGYVRSAEMSGATSSAIQQAKTALEDLKSMAQQQTAPGLSKWLSSLGNDGDAILTKSIRNEFNKAWISEVYNVCEKSINNKYPLNPKSVDFIQLTEFEAFFGPNGTIEKFKEKHLQDQQLSSNVRNQFDRANNIKMMFFPSKRPGLGVAFHLIAKDNLDPRISLSQLDFGNDSLEYKHGPEISKQFTWPDVGANSVRLVLTPASAETMPVELTENGPWAWFHMLDKADIKPATDGYDVTFNVKGYKAAYHINTSINIKELREFHCPARLD